MTDIINLITSNGFAVVIVAYFLYKDWKTTGQIIGIMGETKAILEQLQGFICVKGDTK